MKGKGKFMNKRKVLSVIICLSLILNVVLGIMLYRQNIQYDFLCREADQAFRGHFSELASHLNTACPEDESGRAAWVQEAKHLTDQCLDLIDLTSYDENVKLKDVFLLLRSVTLKWEEYPIGLIPRELAVDFLELSYRLTDDEELLTKVYEALDQLYEG